MKRALVFAVLAFLACAKPDTKAGPELRKVRVSFSPLLSWGPIMIAKAEGFFRDEGIEVEYVPSLSSEDELVALVTGDIDVDPGPLHAGFLSAMAQGAKVRIVAGHGYLAKDACTYYGIVRRAGVEPASVKRVRTSQDGVTRFASLRMLSANGFDVKRLEMVKLPEPVLAMSLESGAIDAASTSEPSLTRLQKLGPLWLSAQKALPDLQWGVVAFNERLLYRDRDTGARFLRAFKRGVAQYQQGKTDRNVAIISEATGDTPEIIRRACWIPFREDLSVDWKSVTEFQAWANEAGLMEHTLTLGQAMDTTFITSK